MLQNSGVSRLHPIFSQLVNIGTLYIISSHRMTSLWSCKTQEDVELNGVAHSIAYCRQTQSLLLCDCFNWTVEHFNYSSSSGLSLQPLRTLKLDEEQLQISSPLSVQISSNIGAIFVGCESDKGISVFDRNGRQLIRKFAENLNRDFDHMVIDNELEDLQQCVIYTSSTNSGKLTKLAYNSGSVLGEVSVDCPSKILLKDDKLYLISRIDLKESVLIIDKKSLEIQNKFTQTGWSSLGGLCLDESRNMYVTACNESNQRMIYRFDNSGNLLGQVRLCEFEEGAQVLDMVFADEGNLIVLVQELGPEFLLKRFKISF